MAGRVAVGGEDPVLGGGQLQGFVQEWVNGDVADVPALAGDADDAVVDVLRLEDGHFPDSQAAEGAQ